MAGNASAEVCGTHGFCYRDLFSDSYEWDTPSTDWCRLILWRRILPDVGNYQGVVHILIANPNAPTGLALPREEIQRIVQSNPNRLVVVDEAYVDFADDGVSSLPLLAHYDNLMVVGTFSKSRSLAGLRLGYAFSRREHIAALERIKYSFHPYNINRFTQQAATIAVQDEAYLRQVLKRIKATRDRSYSRLQELGCKVLPSSTNFLFVSHPTLKGKEFYKLLEKEILVPVLSIPEHQLSDDMERMRK